MPKGSKKVKTDICPNCGENILIPKETLTFSCEKCNCKICYEGEIYLGNSPKLIKEEERENMQKVAMKAIGLEIASLAEQCRKYKTIKDLYKAGILILAMGWIYFAKSFLEKYRFEFLSATIVIVFVYVIIGIAIETDTNNPFMISKRKRKKYVAYFNFINMEILKRKSAMDNFVGITNREAARKKSEYEEAIIEMERDVKNISFILSSGEKIYRNEAADNDAEVL